MKRVCLDTDFLVALLRNYPDAVTKAGEYDSTEIDVATTTMNAFELYLGAFRTDKAAQNVTISVLERLCTKKRVPTDPNHTLEYLRWS